MVHPRVPPITAPTTDPSTAVPSGTCAHDEPGDSRQAYCAEEGSCEGWKLEQPEIDSSFCADLETLRKGYDGHERQGTRHGPEGCPSCDEP